MKISRMENIIVVDSSGLESTCITSTGGGKFSALAVDSLTSTGAISAVSLSAGTITSTGTISGASITSTGAISGASISSTGAISGLSLSAGTITSTGALSGATITSTGAISGASISSTGQVTSFSVPLNFVEDGTTTVNLKAYGVSLLAASTAATTRKFYTLDAPIKGICKKLMLASTIAPMGSSDATIVNTGSSNIQIMTYLSTAINVDYTNIAFQTPLTYVELMGVSTSKWALTEFKSASTNVTYTGLAGLSSGLSTGIVST